jgi:hypothetical protein
MAGEIGLAVVIYGARTNECLPIKKENVVWAASRDHRVEGEPVLPLNLCTAPRKAHEPTVALSTRWATPIAGPMCHRR